MWVFGYGSLMWDSWDDSPDCLRSCIAELPQYRRSFTKASVKNWGTRDHPCPTLTLDRDDLSSCWGIAFEFEDRDRPELLEYLKHREGRNFAFNRIEILLEGNTAVYAMVSKYEGTNILDAESTTDLAKLVHTAKGDRGDCITYLERIVRELAELDIKDEYVISLWNDSKALDLTG